MAEATLAVSTSNGLGTSIVPNIDENFDYFKSGQVVSCGTRLCGTKIKIGSTRENGKLLKDLVVGEVLIQSPSIAPNYLGEDSGSLLSQFDDVFYYRSGDLGFIANGELYICGRAKELLILNGENYSPVLIEDLCLSALGLARSKFRTASFVRKNAGLNELCLALEWPISRQWDSSFEKALNTVVFDAIGVELSKIFLYRKGTLAHTSSGKIMRSQVAQQHQIQDELQTGIS